MNANRTKSLLTHTEKCLNHQFLLKQLKITRVGKASRKDGCVVLRHGRTCSKMCWEVLRAGKQKSGSTFQRFKSLLGWSASQEELESVGELSDVCSQMVLICLYLALIGRPDILWTVSKFTRSVTKMDRSLWKALGSFDFIHSSLPKWTKACDKRLNRLISYIHHTCEYKQYCYVGNTAKHCRLGLFQDPDFARDLEDSKSSSGGIYVYSEAEHLFSSVGRLRSKRQYPTVLQNQKLLRWMLDWEWTDCLLRTYEMWWEKCYIHRTVPNHKNPAAGNCVRDPERDRTSRPKQKGNRDVDQLSHVDHGTTHAHSFQGKSQLYTFQDNIAKIKMISKGGSPTMRHRKRTHRVVLGWLFDRDKLDPQIQIKYVDTKKPTRWHIDQVGFHTWWVESSSSIVEHHGFFNVFLTPSYKFSLWSDREAVRYGKQPERGNGSGKDEAHELKVWSTVVSQAAARNSPRGPLTMARRCILKRGNKTMLKPLTPGNRGEETKDQLNPQLETVCERERSIPSEGESWNSTICRSQIQGVSRMTSQTSRKCESCRGCTTSVDPSTQNQHF